MFPSVYSYVKPIYLNISKILIPIVNQNRYIEDLILKKEISQSDSDGNIQKQIQTNIGYSIDGYIENILTQKPYSITWSGVGTNGVLSFSFGEEVIVNREKKHTRFSSSEILEKLKRTEQVKNEYYNAETEINATIELSDKTNTLQVVAEKTTINDIEYWQIENLTLLVGVKNTGGKNVVYLPVSLDETTTYNYTILGNGVYYIPTQIEITINGNTIGIDLQDQTVYINGETAKKVHSVDGNELMQTTNYIKRNYDKSGLEFVEENLSSLAGNNYYVQYTDGTPKDYDLTVSATREGDSRTREFVIRNGEIASNKLIAPKGKKWEINEANFSIPQIQDFFKATQEKYKIGKETATIRCSIADYFDGDEKVISIDNSTGKMSFKMYDQVIPMVYGSDGKDRPMSLYKDGSAKVFQVLGSKIYYDGAVWQELSLQEIDKSEIL
jgi:hypothetical protein